MLVILNLDGDLCVDSRRFLGVLPPAADMGSEKLLVTALRCDGSVFTESYRDVDRQRSRDI